MYPVPITHPCVPKIGDHHKCLRCTKLWIINGVSIMIKSHWSENVAITQKYPHYPPLTQKTKQKYLIPPFSLSLIKHNHFFISHKVVFLCIVSKLHRYLNLNLNTQADKSAWLKGGYREIIIKKTNCAVKLSFSFEWSYATYIPLIISYPFLTNMSGSYLNNWCKAEFHISL